MAKDSFEVFDEKLMYICIVVNLLIFQPYNIVKHASGYMQ